MPNWSYNEIAIRGTKQEVINFLNDGLKQTHGRKKSFSLLADNATSVEIEDKLRNYGLSLRSWLPMPRTFIKWDTTNRLQNFDWWLDEKILKHKVEWKAIQENIEAYKEQYGAEYAKYCKGYEKAKKYQQRVHGHVGWYDYNCATLGTKWNSEFEGWELVMDNDDDFVVIGHCDTAWSMPEAWLQRMRSKYPLLHFYMYAWEESYAYIGYFDGENPDDWTEKYDYKQAANEVAEKHPDLDNESEEYYNVVSDILNEHMAEIHEHFMEYICK